MSSVLLSLNFLFVNRATQAHTHSTLRRATAGSHAAQGQHMLHVRASGRSDEQKVLRACRNRIRTTEPATGSANFMKKVKGRTGCQTPGQRCEDCASAQRSHTNPCSRPSLVPAQSSGGNKLVCDDPGFNTMSATCRNPTGFLASRPCGPFVHTGTGTTVFHSQPSSGAPGKHLQCWELSLNQ